MSARALLGTLVAVTLALTPREAAAAAPRADDAAGMARESVDPDYVVYLRPGGLVALDPDHDSVRLSVSRRAGGPRVARYLLRVSLAAGSTRLAEYTLVAEATAEGRAEALVGPLPLAATIGRGRLAGLVPRWHYDGLTLRVELRENDDRGRLVYRLFDPNRSVAISWTGFLERLGLAIALSAIALGLVAGWRFGRDRPAPERALLRNFDVAGLGALGVGCLAFGPFAVLALPPLATTVVLWPAGLKHSAAEAIRRATAGERTLLVPALVASVLAAGGFGWHVTLVRAFGLTPAQFEPHLSLLAGGYTIAGTAVSTLLHALVVRRRRRGQPLRPLASAWIGAVLALAAVRAVDWATFFHTGAHVDGEFWRHAFYPQNVKLLAAGLGLWLLLGVGLVLLVAAALFRAATRFALSDEVQPRRALSGALTANAGVAFLLCAALTSALRTGPAAPRAVSDTVREAFAALPEYVVAASLLAWRPSSAAPPSQLEPDTRARLESAGIRLATLRTDFPLLRPSIHLSPQPEGRDKPTMPAGTNLVIVLVESLSSALLDERVHGVRGLTPNFEAFAARSIVLRRLWAAEFPTIRGETATLGAFFFGPAAAGPTRWSASPLQAPFLFLPEVLGSLGYTSLHAQSDFGTFAETARLFTRNGYQRVLSAESPEIQARVRHPMDKAWGVYDEDLFAAVVDLLRRGEPKQPFLLTIATTDTHFPYAVLRRHPLSAGNELLDALHTTDAAFGVFWDYLQSSPYAANTLVLVTADHALVRRALRYAEGGDRLSQFDWIAGLLHVPSAPRWQGVFVDTTCSQVDLAPTLLDVMDIDVENPYLGLSIFGDRRTHPLVLGRELPPVEQRPEAERVRVEALGWTDVDQQRLLGYLTGLARAQRIRPRTRTQAWRVGPYKMQDRGRPPDLPLP